ncbi:MAG: hypothetical protein ACREF4_20955, partial [Gammaproteobacteria bacterium]
MSDYDELNRLEREAASGDEARKLQAVEVVHLRESGKTQQAIADGWIKPDGVDHYSRQHVSFVEKIGRYFSSNPQVRTWTWTDLWDWARGRTIKQRGDWEAANDDEAVLREKGIRVQPYDVWHFASCHPEMGAEHPGRIPGEIVCHVLYFYTQAGDL